MEIKTLENLSSDSTNNRYATNSQEFAYDLDSYVKKSKLKCKSADSLIDDSLKTTCSYINFIEFKCGKIEKINIRLKAIDSLFVYMHWKNLKNLTELPKELSFLLVYKDDGSSNTKIRARNIISDLKDNLTLKTLYTSNINYCSGKELENNFDKYIK